MENSVFLKSLLPEDEIESLEFQRIYMIFQKFQICGGKDFSLLTEVDKMIRIEGTAMCCLSSAGRALPW